MKTLVLGVAAFAMSISAADVTVKELRDMEARFAPVDLSVDTGKLSAGDRAAIVKLVEAARVVDHIFLQQIWTGNLSLQQKLQGDKSGSGQGPLRILLAE